MNQHSTRNFVFLYLMLVVFVSLIASALQAQPVLTKVEAEKLRPGQVADLVLRGTGFGEIQKINAVQIGDFDIAILEQKVSSDSEIKLIIRVPKQIRPGVYRQIFHTVWNFSRSITRLT